MQRVYLIIGILLSLVLTGCNENDDVIELGGTTRIWNCKMIISNSEGKDLVEPIRHDPVRESYIPDNPQTNIHELASSSYQMVENGTDEDTKLYVDITTSPRILSFVFARSAKTADELENYKESTYKLVCPALFGDNEEHLLTAYWTKKLTRVYLDHSDDNVCSRLVIDGKSFEAEEDGIIRIVM